MKDYIYIFVSLLIASIFYGCNNSVSIKESSDASNDSVIIEDSTDSVNPILVPTIGLKKAGRNITDADSLETFFYTDGKCEKPLFSIVSGGNIVCMNDSMLDIDNEKYALFTIADYGQEDQIYYVLYNIADERIIQSERINLPFLGLNIKSYRQLTPIAVDSDSVRIKTSETGEIFSIGLTHFDCDSAQIINYYEYE